MKKSEITKHSNWRTLDKESLGIIIIATVT
jgi:hypothetical protein